MFKICSKYIYNIFKIYSSYVYVCVSVYVYIYMDVYGCPVSYLSAQTHLQQTTKNLFHWHSPETCIMFAPRKTDQHPDRPLS